MFFITAWTPWGRFLQEKFSENSNAFFGMLAAFNPIRCRDDPARLQECWCPGSMCFSTRACFPVIGSVFGSWKPQRVSHRSTSTVLLCVYNSMNFDKIGTSSGEMQLPTTAEPPPDCRGSTHSLLFFSPHWSNHNAGNLNQEFQIWVHQTCHHFQSIFLYPPFILTFVKEPLRSIQQIFGW